MNDRNVENRRHRVARAIMEARTEGACLVEDWDREKLDDPHVAEAVRQADAAISALAASALAEHMRDPGGDGTWIDDTLNASGNRTTHETAGREFRHLYPHPDPAVPALAAENARIALRADFYRDSLAAEIADRDGAGAEREAAVSALADAASALEKAAGLFGLMRGVGPVNGIDPKACHRETVDAALASRRAASAHVPHGRSVLRPDARTAASSIVHAVEGVRVLRSKGVDTRDLADSVLGSVAELLRNLMESDAGTTSPDRNPADG